MLRRWRRELRTGDCSSLGQANCFDRMNQKLAASNRSHLAGRHGLWTLLCVQALTGCISLPGSYRIPDLSLPAQYQDAASTGTAPSTSGQTAAAPVETSPSNPPEPAPAKTPVDWWRDFGNRELQGLIDRALSNNPDIRIALNRIVQAKARAEQAAAGKYPGLSAPLVIAQQSPGGVTVGTAPAGGVSNVSSNRTSQRTYQASIRADWRLDIWGEQSALADSANFQLWRAVHERENVQRNLTASLATHYVEFLSLNDRLRIAVETEEVLSATLATIEKRVKAGDATLSELEQQRAAIFAIRATIPTLEQQKLDAIGAMAFLLGTVPGKLKLSNDGLDSLTIPSVAPGLPSALLLRRPDVRVAEAQLLAANADVNVARARILPPMDLSAQIGYSGIALSQLFQPQTLFWNVVDNLVVSIFDGGRKRNEQLFSQAVREEMVESYARTVYQAMKEVESALTAVRLAERRLTAQWEASKAARRAWDINTRVYAVGGIDYLSLLETQRSYHRYQDDYQKIRMEFFRGYISLFQALGGGLKAERRAPADDEATAGSTRPLPRSTEAIPVVYEDSQASTDTFWQVELAGLYHRSTIDATWRDLRNRYPFFMEGRSLQPRLKGRIEEGDDVQQSWYQLYIANFNSQGEAEEYCLTLKADQQRCRVVSPETDATLLDHAPPRRPGT